MAIKAIVDNIDDVDEALKSYYKQDGDKYVLDLDDSVKTHPEVSSLKNAYEKEQEKRRKAAEERDKYKEIADKVPEDFDADEFERLKANGEGGEDIQRKVEEARERERKRHEKTIEQLKAERDDLSQKYRGTRVETTLKDTLSEINVAPHLRNAAEKLWRSDVQIDDEGNVVTKDGAPIKDAVKEWAEGEEGSHFVAAPGNRGGGASGGSGQPKGANPFAADQWNVTEQARIARDEPEKAKRLAQAAGVKPPRV